MDDSVLFPEGTVNREKVYLATLSWNVVSGCRAET